MELNEAIKLLKNAVKHTGSIDQNHIDLTLVSVDDRPKYEEAIKVAKTASIEGKITWAELLHSLHLD
jgi:hypothetical protein